MSRVWVVLMLVFFSSSAISQEVSFVSGSSLTESQVNEVLEFHNQTREEVGVKPMEWSEELATFAQEWSDRLAFSKGCRMEARPVKGKWEGKYGENLDWSSGYKTSEAPLLASKVWADEKKDFKNKPIHQRNLAATGHYTQMVWHNTSQMGMGMTSCENGDVIVLANIFRLEIIWEKRLIDLKIGLFSF